MSALSTTCFTRYLCLFLAKSIWKGEKASVTYSKTRVVKKQGLRSAFIWNSFTKLKHIFSANWDVTKLWLWQIRDRACCVINELEVRWLVFLFLVLLEIVASVVPGGFGRWSGSVLEVLVDEWEMQPRCEGGDPGDGEFPSGVVRLELVALETHFHMSWIRGSGAELNGILEPLRFFTGCTVYL